MEQGMIQHMHTFKIRLTIDVVYLLDFSRSGKDVGIKLPKAWLETRIIHVRCQSQTYWTFWCLGCTMDWWQNNLASFLDLVLVARKSWLSKLMWTSILSTSVSKFIRSIRKIYSMDLIEYFQSPVFVLVPIKNEKWRDEKAVTEFIGGV